MPSDIANLVRLKAGLRCRCDKSSSQRVRRKFECSPVALGTTNRLFEKQCYRLS
jgi:hypothetical protein